MFVYIKSIIKLTFTADLIHLMLSRKTDN